MNLHGLFSISGDGRGDSGLRRLSVLYLARSFPVVVSLPEAATERESAEKTGPNSEAYSKWTRTIPDLSRDSLDDTDGTREEHLFLTRCTRRWKRAFPTIIATDIFERTPSAVEFM